MSQKSAPGEGQRYILHFVNAKVAEVVVVVPKKELLTLVWLRTINKGHMGYVSLASHWQLPSSRPSRIFIRPSPEHPLDCMVPFSNNMDAF